MIAEAETEADTEAEAMMKEKAEVIEIARDEEEAKESSKDDMIKQVWKAKSLGAKTRGFKPETKSAVS